MEGVGRKLIGLVGSGGLLCCLAGAALAAETGSAAAQRDNRIEKRIETRIERDRQLRQHAIEVQVNDGMATLTGTVPSEAARARAERLARVKGVTEVDNQIQVRTQAEGNDLTPGATGPGTGVPPGNGEATENGEAAEPSGARIRRTEERTETEVETVPAQPRAKDQPLPRTETPDAGTPDAAVPRTTPAEPSLPPEPVPPAQPAEPGTTDPGFE
jgi:hypothetical protein